jgi:hypothetical protein
MFHSYPLLASLEAYLAHHVSKKGEAKYASHVTLSHCVSYLTLCQEPIYSVYQR